MLEKYPTRPFRLLDRLCRLATTPVIAFWVLFASESVRAESGDTAVRMISVVTDFPGGNVVVEEIRGDTIRLHQDERDTPRFWFYWSFEVQGAQGRTVSFVFTKGNVFGSRGPAVSLDEGHSWSWLGSKAVDGDTFRYLFGPDARKVRFAFSIPYTEINLSQFMKKHSDNPSVRTMGLVKTGKNRAVELLRVGRIDGQAKYRVLLSCRHHACESIANFVLEGVLESALSETPTGRWFREQVEVIAIPFMDKDGVEAGDQGKLRHPHDHWLDYEGESRYAETRALRALFEEPQTAPSIDVAIDLHCPYIRDDKLYFAHGSDASIAEATLRFCRLFEQHQSGPLLYQATSDSRFGTGWNIAGTYEGRRSFWQWAQTLPQVKVVTTLEIPYASVDDVDVDPMNARVVGHDLANAIHRFLGRE